MYQAYLLLKADTDFTFAEARKRLAERFPEAAFTEDANSLAMVTDDWDIAFTMNAGANVLAESRLFAEQITGTEDDQQGIGTCQRRVEISSDVPDPEMDHFDQYLKVLDAMQSFQGVIAIDPSEPSVF
jgi:hypothetical protein